MLIPMNQTPVLIESSFLDAIAIIAASTELPKQTQRHWTTSLRQIAKALDKPLELIPARLGAVRADLARLHHLPTGLTLKTLRNHKSNVKSALLWLAREKRIPKHGAPLTPAWEELRARIKDQFVRWRLSAFMRFCSASGIAPAEVDEVVLEHFLRYRAQSGTTGPNLEFECRKYPGLADAPAQGAGGEADHGAAVDGVSRGPPPGS